MVFAERIWVSGAQGICYSRRTDDAGNKTENGALERGLGLKEASR